MGLVGLEEGEDMISGGAKMLTHFSVCTGVGGIDLAAEEAGFTTVGQCEIDDYCTRVLEKHWPGVPRWRDIRDVTRQSVSERGIGRIDLLSGGIPCQPHSCAGKRQGSADERDLWPEYARLIREFRPGWALVENVCGLLSSESGRFFARILRDLAQMGYDAGWCVFGANAVGAPHGRQRVFIVANSFRGGRGEGGQQGGMAGIPGEWPDNSMQTKESNTDVVYSSKCRLSGKSWRRAGQKFADGYSQLEEGDVAYSQGQSERTGLCQDEQARKRRGRFSDSDSEAGQSGPVESRLGGNAGRTPYRLDCHRWPAGPGEPQHEWEPPRVARGIKHRTQRLKALGNICVPQQVYVVLKAIADIELTAAPV